MARSLLLECAGATVRAANRNIVSPGRDGLLRPADVDAETAMAKALILGPIVSAGKCRGAEDDVARRSSDLAPRPGFGPLVPR